MPRGKPGTFTRCSVDDCGDNAVGQGLCRKHYTRWWVHGDASVVVDRSRGACTIDGCERLHKARGLCQTHYRRFQRHGDTEAVLRAHRSGSPEDRFWAQVDQQGPIPPHRPELGRCWVWTGYINRYGYGEIAVDQRSVHAHAWGYQRFVGPIQYGLEPDHLCRNRPCVRFDHLEPVTHAENVRRGERASRTHCVQGHPYDEANTAHQKDGSRICVACRREKSNARYVRRREAAGLPYVPRGASKRRPLKTHCPRGHPYEEGNVYHTASGVRLCIACNKERYRRYTEKRTRIAATQEV